MCMCASFRVRVLPALKHFLSLSRCHSLLPAYPGSPGSWGSPLVMGWCWKTYNFVLWLFHCPYAIDPQVGIPTLTPHHRGRHAPHVREHVLKHPLPRALAASLFSPGYFTDDVFVPCQIYGLRSWGAGGGCVLSGTQMSKRVMMKIMKQGWRDHTAGDSIYWPQRTWLVSITHVGLLTAI